MLISFPDRLSHLLSRWFQNRHHSRRKPVSRTFDIEALEVRALLSASAGMLTIEGNQTAEISGIEHATQPENVPDSPAALDVAHGIGRSLKIGQLNHQKMAQSKQAAPVTDFSGHWLLGVNGAQPSDLFELTVQQVGRKVRGTFTIGDGDETQATLKGRVIDSQLFARIRLVGDGSRGVMVVSKLSSNVFQGTMSIKHPGEPLQIVTVVGLK